MREKGSRNFRFSNYFQCFDEFAQPFAGLFGPAVIKT